MWYMLCMYTFRTLGYISFRYHIIHSFKVYNSILFSTTRLCDNHHNQFYNIFLPLEGNLVLITGHSPSLKTPSTSTKPKSHQYINLLSPLLKPVDLLFWTFCIKGVILYAVFFSPVFWLINRHTFEIYWASLYCVSQILHFFLQIEVLWHLFIEQAYQHHFQ